MTSSYIVPPSSGIPQANMLNRNKRAVRAICVLALSPHLVVDRVCRADGSIQLPTGYNASGYYVYDVGASVNDGGTVVSNYGSGPEPSTQSASASLDGCSASSIGTGSYSFNGTNSLTITGNMQAAASSDYSDNISASASAAGGYLFNGGISVTADTWAEVKMSLSIYDSTGNYTSDPNSVVWAYCTFDSIFAGLDSRPASGYLSVPNYSIDVPVFLTPRDYDNAFVCEVLGNAGRPPMALTWSAA